MQKTINRKTRNCTGLIQTFMNENFGHDVAENKTKSARSILQNHLKIKLAEYLWNNCNDRNRADGMTGVRKVCGYTISLQHHTRDEYLNIVVVAVLSKKHVQVNHVKGQYTKRVEGVFELEAILTEFGQY
jgi:hypothetical protein